MGKVEELGLSEEICMMRIDGLSYRAIAKKFQERGFAISHGTVRNWVLANPSRIEHMTKMHKGVTQRVVDTVLNVSEELLKTNQQTNEIFKIAIEGKNYNLALKAIKRKEEQFKIYNSMHIKIPEQALIETMTEDQLKELLPLFYQTIPEQVRNEIANVLEAANTSDSSD